MFARSTIFALAALSFTSTLAQISVSDNFENGWDKKAWPIYAPDCNQGGSVSLDKTTGHSGTNSMKVVGGPNGYCGHIFFGTTDVPKGDQVYVRTWLKHSTPLSDQHVSFIVMPDSSLDGKHLRVSGQMEIIEYNRESDDATLPDLSPDGIASSVGLPTDHWECLEYLLNKDGTIETWLNSKAVPGLTAKPGVTNPNASGWGDSYHPDIEGVYFGWESYSGSVDTFWYDDIVIASSRVGCSTTAGSGSSSSGSKDITTTAPAATSSAAVVESSTVAASTSSAAVLTSSAAPASTSTALPSGGGEECEIVYV